ncbi:MAG: methylthioadenosine phosphorylase [Anaerolineaceae bacterium 4572_78]|nr:MAG: methylthioadenosine phosphorylase [Anaerolineaceae bacterium 4572_78]
MQSAKIAVIGGSGLYNMAGLIDVEEIAINTPYGSTSDNVIIGTLKGERVAFIPRHGRGHNLSPTEVNYRANIYALKSLGVKYIISVSACGSLREKIAPGNIVIPDQLVDRTRSRPLTFFGDGLVVHQSVADPFCPMLSKILYESLENIGERIVHAGGTYVTIEGPRFSTRAESFMFRQWGCDIIGMTTIPEVFLAHEAEIAYAVMAHVTDYDVWHEEKEPVTVEMVIKVIKENVEVAQKAIKAIIPKLADEPKSSAHHALTNAIITDPATISVETKEKLALLVGKYI